MFGFHLPEDFLLGTGSSSFQTEGAWKADGKSESIMDHFAIKFAGQLPPEYAGAEGYAAKKSKTYAQDLPDRGCYFYDNYEAYIEDMKATGQNAYRMSLAWCRIIPTGVGEVNPKGIAFYNKVIDKLVACGITPFVDLHHWDMPQCLMDQGGFANPQFPEWFEAYAKVCFQAFGDRVKLWSTFNESAIAVTSGYIDMRFPPFHHDIKEGHLAGHHCILAHYRAVRAYRAMGLKGKIGAVNCISAVTPAQMNQEDLGAVARQVDRHFGWWTEPMLEGTYPQRLIRECPYIRENMPEHYQEDLDKWFVPMDFIGINYYNGSRTKYSPDKPLLSDRVESFYSRPGQRYLPNPGGLFDVVQYVSERYHVDVYITENGLWLPNIHDEEQECDDGERVSYIREHMRMVARLVRAGYPLKGYFYWCDSDAYEELEGYRLRFGLTWVDHETGRRRWKKSRYYFSQICKTHMVD